VSDPLVVSRRSTIAASAEALWRWHAAPGAFDRLRPPWERVAIVARSAPGLVEGLRVTLRVRQGPVSVRWTARHEAVHPGEGFVDVQERGPFTSWRHAHRFLKADGGAELEDTIAVRPPCGRLGLRLAGPPLHRMLTRMLRYRHDVTRHDLEQQMSTPLPPMRIAITGASGLVGSALVPFLTTQGHTVVPVSRRATPDGIHWDPASGRLDAAAFEGLDAVIHLAGENIAGGRWTRARKAALRDSRVGPTALLATTLASLQRPPNVLLSASAVGIYGDQGDRVLSESAPAADDFLGRLGAAWEEAATPARVAGIRVVHPRFGIILTPEGGALGKMLPTARAGISGPLGSGEQWMSWIAIDDVLGVVHHLLAHPEISGPVNTVSPSPVRNRDFARTLGAVLGRPAVLPVPALALKVLFGEMAEATLLASSRVVPTVLETSGYRFRYPVLDAALRHLLGR
jgi:uncharacterized protein (TIGR01777 family)